MTTTFIRASAGSGKTYTLTKEIAERIQRGEVSPSELITVTFTKRAGAELVSKTAQQLLDRGMLTEAQQLPASLIGTINSVAAQIVSDAAIDVGASPRTRTIDEHAATALLDASADAVLSKVLEDPVTGARTRARLRRLGYSLERTDPGRRGAVRYWAQDALDLVDQARANGLGADDLGDSIDADAVGALVRRIRETTEEDPKEGADVDLSGLTSANRSWLLIAQSIDARLPQGPEAAAPGAAREDLAAALDAAVSELTELSVKVAALADLVDQVTGEELDVKKAAGKRRLAELMAQSEHRDLENLQTYTGAGAPKRLNPHLTTHRATAQGLADGVDELRTLQRDLAHGHDRTPWRTWETIATAGLRASAPVKGCLVHALTERHAHDADGLAVLASPVLHEDLREYLALSYRTAGDVLAAYAEAKAERGVMDFTDQEALALDLLNDSERARASLAGRYTLLAVDEFQDTSPLQMALYLRLTQIIRDVIWVGDPKQSIYRFRGTDPRLMMSVAAEIESIKKGQQHDVFGEVKPFKPLSSSYRSWQHPLDLSNAVSRRLFRRVEKLEATRTETGLPVPERPASGWSEEDELTLQVAWKHRAERSEGADRGVVEVWLPQPDAPVAAEDGTPSSVSPGADKPKDFKAADSLTVVANGVARLLAEERDGGPRVSRLAVLCRSNSQVKEVARALDDVDVPVTGATYCLADTREGQVIDAALAYLTDRGDTIALATLVDRLLDPVTSSDWFEEMVARPDRDSRRALLDGWRGRLDDAGRAPLAELDGLRRLAPLLTPRELVTEVIVATGLDDLAARYPQQQRRRARLDDVLDLAQAYDETCTSQDLAASIPGLRQYVAEGSGELAQQSGEGSVEVLTIHKAKGLSWRTVVSLLPAKGNQTRIPSVLVVSDGFDATAPLEGREVVLTAAHAHGPKALSDAVKAHPVVARDIEDGEAELARLMYVSLTRSEHRSVLVPRQGTIPSKNLLADLGLAIHVPGAAGLIGPEPGTPVPGRLTIALKEGEPGATPTLTSPDEVEVVLRGLPWAPETGAAEETAGAGDEVRGADEYGAVEDDGADGSTGGGGLGVDDDADGGATVLGAPVGPEWSLSDALSRRMSAPEEPSAEPEPAAPVWTDAPRVPDGDVEQLSARFRASRTDEALTPGTVQPVEVIGAPLEHTCRSGWNVVGDALHAYLALPHAGFDEATATAAAERTLVDRGLSGGDVTPVSAGVLVEAGRRWSAWLTERFGEVTEATEVPVAWTTEDNQVMEGRIDSLITTADGRLVLADHKSTIIEGPVGRIEAKYVGQMSVYREAIRLATGRVPDVVLIHMPIRGEVYEIVFDDAPTDDSAPAPTGSEAAA